MGSSESGSAKTKMATAAKTAKTRKTVSGMIVANKNKAGKTTRFALKEDGGEDFLLFKHGKGMQLVKMVWKKVEATGTVQESKRKNGSR